MGRGQARAAWSITPDKFFTAAEIEQLYSYLLSHSKSRRGKVNLFIIEMLLNAGLRATELCELRVEQTPVVLEENAIWVKGKGGKTRWITIVPEMSEKIRTFVREVRPGLLPTRARRSDYTKPLLITEYGGPFNRRSLYKRVRALGQRARLLKRVGPHRFRHTFATHTYRDTKEILLLQEQLGHSSVSTTSVYAKADRAAKVEMMKKVCIFNVRTTLET